MREEDGGAEDESEVEDHADDGGRDSCQGGLEPAIAPQRLDIGSAEEDEEEARKERGPRRRGRTEDRAREL